MPDLLSIVKQLDKAKEKNRRKNAQQNCFAFSSREQVGPTANTATVAIEVTSGPRDGQGWTDVLRGHAERPLCM